NHAEDEVIFVDRSLLGLLAPLVPTFETVRHVVVMDDGAPTEIPSFDGGPEVHTTRSCWPRPSHASGPSSTTRTGPPTWPTRAAPRATPRASSTRTVRCGSTRWA